MKRSGWIIVALCALAGPAGAATPCSPPLTCESGLIELDGIVQVPNGGLGVGTLTNHGVLLGQGTADVVAVTPGNAGSVLCSAGASADPLFCALDLADSDARTGVLPVANGGTGHSTPTDDNAMVGDGTNWAKEPIPTCANGLTYNQAGSAGSRFGCASAAGGTFVRGASTFFDIAPGDTIYISPGQVDATAARALTIAAEDVDIDNLICKASVAPGASQSVSATLTISANCTSAPTDSTDQTTSVSGTNVKSTAATTADSVAAGECYAFELVASASAQRATYQCQWTETIVP